MLLVSSLQEDSQMGPSLFCPAGQGDSQAFAAAELFEVVRDGHDFAKCKVLLDMVAEVNCREPEDGNTPLHVAAEESHVAIVQLLLAAQADPESKNNYCLKPLDLADNNTEAFELLNACTATAKMDRRRGFVIAGPLLEVS
eukprot:TRINITY_DN75300_c0_g1_i1.p1 TRINITY_DN75300_c0_g1~~TRINITY_DN75300_c0_g1_i1.p1  ORF type:complete len:141 (-),score=31.23 TRINITY_DN75300_c0_g1_i1:471-893(-)